MAVFVIAITLLFLGSVSAADDINDVNLTDYDNSLEISELNEIDDVDDVAMEGNTVNVGDEKCNEVLGASNDDVLEGTAYTSLTPVSGYVDVGGVITATVNVPIYVKMGTDYDTSYGPPSSGDAVYIRENQNTYVNLLPSTTYGVATSGEGAPLTFTSVGTYSFLFKVPKDNYDIYSNILNVNVVENSEPLATTVTLELSPSEVIINNNITVIPTVKDENNNVVTSGVVKIYDTLNYYYADPILTINAGETGNYSDSVHSPGYTGYLYGVYFPGEGNYKQSDVSAGASYTLLSSNTLDLTVNGGTEITVENGTSFDVLASLTGGNGVITLYVNGVENITLTKNVVTALTLPVGNYTLSASYKKDGGDFYASAESNEVTVHVVEKSAQNQIVVSVEDVTLQSQVEIKVAATIDGKYTIDVNGTMVEVTVTGGKGSQNITLAAGEYYANVTGQDGANITNAVFTVYPEPKIGELIIRDANYISNDTITISAEGNVTIYIEYYLTSSVDNPTTERIEFNVGGFKKAVDNPVRGTYTGAFSFVVNETADFTINASYYAYKFMEGEYAFESNNILRYSVVINGSSKKDVTLNVTVNHEHNDDNYYAGTWDDKSFDVVTTTLEGIDGVIIYKKGETELGRANIGEEFVLNASALGIGAHEITAVFEGNDSYNGANYTFTIAIAKAEINYVLTIDNVTYPNHAIGKFYANVGGNYIITIGGTDYIVNYVESEDDNPVSFDINLLPVGVYTPSNIVYEDMEHYEFAMTNALPTFEVIVGEVELDSNVLTIVNSTTPTFTISLPNATGNLTVSVEGKNYTAELKDGKATVKITDLDPGNYTATVTYSGDDNYKGSSIESSFVVKEKVPIDANSTLYVTIPDGSPNPVFSINLTDATGNLTVTIGNKTYTKELVNGSATIVVDDLNHGSYNATITYSGDDKYPSISKNTTITIPKPVLKASNVNAVYSAKAYYKVLVTVNGKAVAGENVSIKLNGITYSAITDKYGYAVFKVKTNVKPKKYVIISSYKGVQVKNIVKVAHVIKAKNYNVKKSKKVTKVKIKLKKVDGKYLKNKKLKIKFKGKFYNVKTGKKGVATWKVKKSMLKKLKVGKKYKYQVKLGNDKVTKKLKIKR